MDPRDASASKNENVAQIGGRPAQIDVDSNLGNAQNKGCFFLGSLPFDVTPRNTRFMSFLPTALIDS